MPKGKGYGQSSRVKAGMKARTAGSKKSGPKMPKKGGTKRTK